MADETTVNVDGAFGSGEAAPTTPAPTEVNVDHAFETPVPYTYQTASMMGDLGVRLGVVPNPDSGWGDAAMRGVRDFQLGIADTMASLGSDGAADYANGLRAMMAVNQQRYNREGASFMEEGIQGTVAMAPSLLVGAAAAALSAGTATPEAAALIGTSLKAYRAAKAITAAKVFGGATMELQQYGGFIDEIHAASGGRLTTAQEHGLAMGRALTDWTIENYTFPGEAILSVGAANFGKAVVGKMLKREAGRDALELTGQSVFGFPLLGGFGRFAQSFPMEVLEEGGQRVNGNLWNAFASGDKMSLADITAGSMTDMIQSIPTVTLMSGFGAFVGGVKDEARRQTLTQGLNQPDHPVWKTVDQVLGGKADGTIDPAYVQKVEDAKAALIEMWSKTDKAAKDAPAAAEMAVQIAKKLAVEARSAGDSTASFDNYFQGMSVAFGDFSLNDLSTIHDMTVGGSTSQQVYDFMVKTNPSFSENMDTFHGAMRRLELTRENKSIRDSLKVVIADMAPASYLYGYPLEDLGRRLADAVKGLPVAKITSDTGMGFIPKEYVKAVVGNEKTAEALAVTPVKLTLGTTEGTLHVQPDGSAIFYPTLKTEKGKVKEKATAKQIAVKTAEQEAADITANAEQVEASLKAAAQERIASATPTGQTTQGNLAAKEIGLNSGLQTAPQRTLGQLVAENIYLKHRFSQMQNFRKNWNEIGAIPDTGTKGGTTPTTTPDQGTTPKLLKAVGVQQAYQEKVALDLGLTFNGVQKLPGEPDQHVYTDTQTKSTFYVPADATVEQVTAKRDEMRKKFEGTPLAQDEGAIKGLYLSDRLLMAYFKDADAGTLLHEWTHHLTTNRLLPDSLSKVLVNSYGDDKEKARGFLSTSRSHEAVANALLKYIRDGVPPSNVDGRIVQAFEYIKGVLKASGDQLKTYVTIQAGENAEADGNAKVIADINAGPPLAQVSPEQDARYLKLAKDPEGNKAELQRMVDESAKKAGYNGPWYHASLAKFNVYDLNAKGGADGTSARTTGRGGVSLARTEDGARAFVRRAAMARGLSEGDIQIYKLYAKTVSTFDAFNAEHRQMAGVSDDVLRMKYPYIVQENVDALKQGGFDSSFVNEQNFGRELSTTGLFVLEPSQIKSADPITYDDKGNVIPLSARFNPESPSILFQKSQVKDINVPPSVAELFSSLLSNTTATPEQMDAGHAVTESMRNNPPATPETEDAVIESINEMADEAENAPLAQAAPKKEGKAWQKIHGQFNKAALNLATKKFGYQIEKPVDLGLDSNGNHNENLYFQRLNELASDLSAQRRHKAVFRMRRTKSADTAKEGRDLAKEIKPLYEALPDSAEAQAYQFDGGPRPFTWAKLAAKKILNFDLRWFGDLRTLALHFSNGDVNHPFNQAMEGRTRDDANTITEITTKMGEKLKAAMTFNPVEAVKLGGRDWTVQAALYFYISANGQRVTQTEAELDRKSLDGTISHTEEQVLALIKSNSKVLPGNKGKVELSTINDAVDFVKADKALVNFAKLGVELSAVAKRMIDESFVQVGAKAPGTIQGMFVPRIRTDGRFDGGWIEEFVKGLQGGKNAGLSTPGSTRTRSNTIGSAINTEYVDILINYLNTMVNAAVRLPTAHTLLTMLDELQPVMEQKFGYTLRPNSNAGSQNVLFERVRDVVRQTMTTSGRLEQLGPGDIWWSKMASNTALATLAFKPWVQVISQMFSMLTGMSDIAPMKGMATYGRLMRDTLGVMGKDIRSGKITEFPLENHPIFQKLKDKSPSVIGAMSGEWEIFEAMTRRPDFVDNFVRKMGWGRNKVETYFYTMKVMDMIAKCAIFDTKYTAVKAEMMEKRMSESVAEREAVKEAERAVLNHIPMIASQNKVLFQTANPVLRAFAPFVSQIVTYHNTLVRKFITPALGAYQLAQGSEGQKALAALKTLARPGMVKNAAFLWLMPALLWNMVMRRRPPDEKELLTDILTYPLSVTPVIGDIVQSLTGSGIIRQPGPIILTDTKRGIESLQDIYQALFDDEDIDLSRTYRNLIAAPADYWALPKYFLEAPSRIADIRADFPKGERLEAAFKQFVFGGQSKPTD